MRSLLMMLATAVSMVLLACGIAVADTVTTNFEGLNRASVNGQDGWKSAPPGSDIPGSPTGEFDQAVVANGGIAAAFGQQSLRMSNRYASRAFSTQTYSEQATPAAGETASNTEYIGQFSFIPATPDYQPGLLLTVSPDAYDGSRMSWVGLQDTAEGIEVHVSDSPDVDGNFEDYNVALLKDRTVPHTIRFWIKVNPGVDNDRVQVAIDGDPVEGPTVPEGGCFTTWENYYRTAEDQAGPPNNAMPASINSLQFRSSVPAPDLITGGYMFDNVSSTTANGPGPPADCSGDPPDNIDIDKTTRTRFAHPGDLITYKITVRNRGDAPARRLRTCDRAPRALKFVRASRHLRRAAGSRRLCLTFGLIRPGQRRTFRATFRLRANVTAGTVTNGASADTPTGSAPSPSPPERARKPQRRRVAARDAAVVGVLGAGARSCSAALNHRARAAC